MNFRILIPYWGNDPKYFKLLSEWHEAYKRLNLLHPVTLITDTDSPCHPFMDWKAFETPAYNKLYTFDHKGDLVCAALLKIHGPVLVVDSDAVLQHDAEPLLRPFDGVAFAMPADEGAYGRKLRNRHGQDGPIPKRCAGVMWFGGADREQLVKEYRAAFATLGSGKYYEERRLYEQHAWTMVAHQRNAPFLPRTLNWLANNSRNGPNPEAAIYHNVGQRKFTLASQRGTT
jgi:hypothetical protein